MAMKPSWIREKMALKVEVEEIEI
ncbi:hypothetical protein CCACVL1_04433 [Corchorus capsularis]|uniref:Uncharacterized protein n=1 Tax=Corchorus capsularis TaxID=210143 RepID=A0A1R3JSX0_COCAP|nr:hypothetical protein CCACVL1_04433 [Corchorus capsularis]